MSDKQTRKKRDVVESAQLGVEQLFELANSYYQQGDLNAALMVYKQIVRLEPRNIRALHAVGVVSFRLGATEDGISSIRMALDINPDYAEAWNSLGNIFSSEGLPVESMACYRRALELEPYRNHTRLLFADLLRHQGDLEQALEQYDAVLAVDPTAAGVCCEAARVCEQMGRLQEAEERYRLTLDIDPANVPAMNNLANLYNGRESVHVAFGLLIKAAAIRPDMAEIWLNIGNSLLSAGFAGRALRSYARALGLRPDFAEAHSNLLFAMNYIPGMTMAKMSGEAENWVNMQASPECFEVDQRLCFPLIGRRLRIGFVSGDFNSHPVSCFLLPLFSGRTREQFEFCCYMTSRKHDEVTSKFQSLADGWRDISGLDDAAAAELVSDDRIDILVDLAGHTEGNRLSLFSRRPAPLQVSWIGYFNTSGLKAIDYFIADRLTVPPRIGRFFSEAIAYLPETRFCFPPPEYAPDVAPAPVLASGAITFGCFNNTSKINIEVVRLWGQLLQKVPDSRLLLKSAAFDDEWIRRRYQRLFKRVGVAGDRLILVGCSPYLQLLEEYSVIDIALDTFPFSGGATSCDALWMGVPVVTLANELPAGRQTAAFLALLGLPELVAADKGDYLSIAADLARDVPRLARLRSEIRGRMSGSPLCDTARFVGNVESLFKKIWSRAVARSHRDKTRSELAGLYHAYGQKFMHDGQYRAALSALRKAVTWSGGGAEVYNDLGIAMYETGEARKALSCFKKAISTDPAFDKAYNNLGRVLLDAGQHDQARVLFKRALDIDSGNADAWYNLGTSLLKLGMLKEAGSSLETSLTLRPDFAPAHNNLGNLLLLTGNVREAQLKFRDAISLLPGYSDAMSNLMLALQYLPESGERSLYEESTGLFGSISVPQVSRSSRLGAERIKIGFVSHDFRKHAVSYFLKPLLREIDRNSFETFCYASLSKPDNVTMELKALAEHWLYCADMDDSRLAEIITADRIDILVDCAGHTAGNRLGVFIRKPAPTQLTWLGYPGTTGLESIDYRITDELADPAGESDLYHSERLIRLPHGFISYEPPAISPEVAAPPSHINGIITFGSFNNLAKLNYETVQLWSRILNAVDGAALILKNRSFACEDVRNRWLELFVSAGCRKEAINLLPPLPGEFEHLECYQAVDIALDTFPYNGTTTTCEALWMGVPVVTLQGSRHASRVGGSIIGRLGLGELIASTQEEYLDIALRLARDAYRLDELRFSLRGLMRNSLCDAGRFARDMESAWRQLMDAPWENSQKCASHFYQLGREFELKRKYAEAAACYGRSIDSKAAFPEPYNYLGNIKVAQGRMVEARSLYRQALQIRPDYPECLSNLGNIYNCMGLLDDAVACFSRALELRPELHQVRSNMIFFCNYRPRPNSAAMMAMCRDWQEMYAAALMPLNATFQSIPDPDRPLRIGYVSPDFRQHSVSYFLEPLLEKHGRENVITFCYSDVLAPDQVTRRLMEYADGWRNCTGFSDEQLADCIREDAIDILVDLAGHTSDNRLLVFARKPAPVQVSWLGYPATTGVLAIDYRIGDRLSDPVGLTENHYTEELIRLPNSFICYRPPAEAPATVPPPCLANGYVTYGSFNSLLKITQETIEIWSQILSRMPCSRLILKNRFLSDRETVERVYEWFAGQGVGKDRVELRPVSAETVDHLAMYGEIDIALDTFPYNGTTTTCEALWMGVPVIVLTGNMHAGRVGTSIMGNLKLEDCMADSPDGYVLAAVSLAEDKQRLLDLRLNLRNRMKKSAICDEEGFVFDMEQAYRVMWRAWCRRSAN